MNIYSNKLVDRNRYKSNLSPNNYSIHLELICIAHNKRKDKSLSSMISTNKLALKQFKNEPLIQNQGKYCAFVKDMQYYSNQVK